MAKKTTPQRKKTKPAHRSLKPLLWGAGIAGLVLLACIVGAAYAFSTYGGEERWVYIPAEATDDAVADSLESTLGKGFGSRVTRLWEIQGGKTSTAHGAYFVKPGISALTLSRNIAKGRQTPVRISWNGARTIGQIAARLSRNIEADSTAMAAAITNVLNARGVAEPQHIGSLLPDTYEVYWSATPESIVEKLHENYLSFWNDERKAKAKTLGLTPEDVAIVASIAEEETADQAERAVVGRLYINRLNIGMPLQADPTVRYAIGDYTIKRVTAAHTRYQSPYNTYVNKGLPPGPIRNPSAATLQGILDSEPNDYLYMCAKEDFSGHHNFSSDYATHLKNAARYQAELNRRGIR